MDENKHSMPHEFTVEWASIKQCVCEIQELVDDVLDSKSTRTDYYAPAMPAEPIAERLLVLVLHLKKVFAGEESDDYRSDFFDFAACYTDELNRLHAEHAGLIQMLNDVYVLAGSPVRPASSWSDIDRRFRHFINALANHERREESLIQRAICDDVGVGD